MKKVICVLTILVFCSNLFAQEKVKSEQYENGYLDGRVSANDDYKGGGWFAAGFGSGVLLGLIGTGVIAGVSQIGSVEPPDYEISTLSNMPSDYKTGFFKGYSGKVKNTRLKKSLFGGLIGTAVIVTVIVATQGNN